LNRKEGPVWDIGSFKSRKEGTGRDIDRCGIRMEGPGWGTEEFRNRKEGTGRDTVKCRKGKEELG
jgi:hypothetical protein